MSARDAGPPDESDGPAGATGSDSRPALGPDTLAHAVGATRALVSARVELTTTVDGPLGTVVLSHRAAFVDGGLRASAESDMSQVARALDAAGQQLDGDWSHPARVVVEAGTVYSQLGPMAESLGRAPGDWASAELADLVGSGAVTDNDTLALALDPLGPLDQLLRPVVEIAEVPYPDAGGGAGAVAPDAVPDADMTAAGTAHDPGEAGSADQAGSGEGSGAGSGDEDGRVDRAGAACQVRGTAVRHVRARLDLAGGAEGPSQEGSFEARMLAAGVNALPVDVWLDDEEVVRRLVVTVDAAGGLTTRFDVYDVGVVGEADVAPPSLSA